MRASIARDIRSGPIMTWIGRLSASASSSWSAVTMQQEKSCAVLSTPERAVRNSVLAILRAIVSRRLASIAMRTPSCCARSAGDHGLAPCSGTPQTVIDRLPSAVRRGDRARVDDDGRE